MRGVTRFGICLLVVLNASVFFAEAQSTGSSLRGFVKDAQGGVLPGVTVTATSPDMITPATGVTDETGYYRLINLPPGEYTVSAELPGFSAYERKGILLRAAVNFQVDIVMAIGTLAETITVSGDSPMLEVSKPGNVLNIDGEFQKQMPLAARKNWTDFLEQTPGVHSRPFDDGSGRSVYFGHATEHFAHVVQLEGMQAGNYNDFQLTYVQMGSDMIQDIHVKTGGSDASTPMGTGLGINVITKSGGNVVQRDRRVRIPAAPLGPRQHPPQDRLRPLGDAARPAFNLPEPGMHDNRRHARAGRHRSVRRLVRRADHEGQGLVLRLVPQVSRRDSDQPELEKRQRHPELLSRHRLVPPADQGIPAICEGHLASRSHPRVVGVLPARPHARPEQLAVLLRSHQRVLEWRQRLQRQDHVDVGRQNDDDVLGRLQQQERQRQRHLRRVRVRRPGTEHRYLRRHAHLERFHHGQLAHPRGREPDRREPSCRRRCL